jgi:hypothetical protein
MSYHPDQIPVRDLPRAILLTGPHILVLGAINQDFIVTNWVLNTGIRGEEVRSLEVRHGNSIIGVTDVDVLSTKMVLSCDKHFETGTEGIDDGLYTIEDSNGVRVVGTGIGDEDLSQGFEATSIDGKGI